MTPEKTKQVIEERLGKPLHEVFAWIDLSAPLGSASIAQVLSLSIRQLGTTHSSSTSYGDN